MISCIEVISTSEGGDRLSLKPNVAFVQGEAQGNVIRIFPDRQRQTLSGIGTSFTEASAYVLAHLEPDARDKVMRDIFSDTGANFSLARTPIGSCDFCVEGNYSYASVEEDMELSHFDISVDTDGFCNDLHPGVKDESYDLIPMIQHALAIKSEQQEQNLRIISSAWTAPPWMKDIDSWYQAPARENAFAGTGGSLKPGYESIYARYLVKYLEAYREHGIDIWGLTPVNEPLGNSGQWESMHFTPQSQKAFISDHLGPALQKSGNNAVKLLIYDHSRDQLESWMNTICTDPSSAQYVFGAAVHWYESTFKVFEDVFDRVHARYPDYAIIHTEGCIDNLGNDAPDGVLDPAGYKESGWFQNDDFWWNDNATDWGYSVTWPGVDPEDHPAYTPVHRYARNIIVSLNHWVCGWIDWNIVLDRNGGPNHVGNHCGAPIMIDVTSRDLYYTPVYFILAQFSRTLRPGDRVVENELIMHENPGETLYACATIANEQFLTVHVLNTNKQKVNFTLQIEKMIAEIFIEANSLLTVRMQRTA